MNALLGTFLGAAGVAGLYSSWRKFPLSGPLVVGLSWGLLAISLWAWCRSAGVEFGTSYAFLALSLLGGVAVLLNFEMRQRKQSRVYETRAVVVDPRSWWRHITLFLLAVPVAGVAAVFATVWLCSLLPWQAPNEMALAVLLAPALWGLAAYWICADSRPFRPALVMLALIAVPALILYL